MPTCHNCGNESDGGIYTNGDPYGDRRKINLPINTPRFYCWDCADQARSFMREQSHDIDIEFARLGLCGFVECWIGRCRNTKPCIKHLSLRCWKPGCDNPAVANCSVASTFVCGIPYCADHPHEEEQH